MNSEPKRSHFRDKDYLVTDSGVIFKVKEYRHPADCVSAFPRFIPFDVIPMRLWGHTWKIGGREYSRFDLRVTTTVEIRAVWEEFFQRYPRFKRGGSDDQPSALVPWDSIIEHVTPARALQRIRSLERQDSLQRAAIKFADICLELGVPAENLGVTDSLMFDAHTIGFSDIDFVIVGASNYRQVVSYLGSDRCDNSIRFPTAGEWERRYSETAVKDMPLSPGTYARHKIRKYEESSIDGHKLSLFAVRDQAECERAEGANCIEVGPREIAGTVIDASEGMFRPSVYRVKLKNLIEREGLCADRVTIVNHRREYISQVREHEDIRAFGLVKESDGELILELGSLALRGQDYLISSLLA